MKKVLKFVLPILVILGLIFLSYVAYIALKPKDIVLVNYISLGDTFLEQSSYSLALEQYKKGINQDPKDIRGYIKASNIYLLKNDTEQSIKILLEGEKNTSSEEIYLELVKVYGILKDFSKAYDSSLKITKVTEGNISLVFFANINNGKVSEGKALLEKYIEDSSTSDAKLNLLAGLLNYTDSVKAKLYLSKATVIKEGDSEDTTKWVKDLSDTLDKITLDASKEQIDTNTSNVARLMILSNLNGLGVSILDEVIKKNTEFDLLYLLRGIAKLQSNEIASSKIDLEKAISLNPIREETLTYLARIYSLEKNVQASGETYDKAISLYPNSESLLVDNYNMVLEAGLYSKAEVSLKKLIALKTANILTYKVELAKLYLDKMANYDEVLVITDEIINKMPEYQKALNNVKAEVELYDIWGKYKKSITSKTKYTTVQIVDALNQVIEKYDKSSSRAYLYLGYMYLGTISTDDKDVVKASEALSKCIDLDLNNRFTKEANELLKKTI